MSRTKKILFPVTLVLLTVAGCVSIYDSKVQVVHPDQVDQYNRSIVEQCTPHIYPHRLIQATTGEGYPYLSSGGGLVTNQVLFDQWWAGLSVSYDQDKVVSQNLKPTVDWDHETAYFIPVYFSNACQRVKAVGDEMTTDCYTISIHLLRWDEGDNCQQAPSTYPVLIYIYPSNANLPVEIKWTSPTPIPTVTSTATPKPTPIPTMTPTPDEDE